MPTLGVFFDPDIALCRIAESQVQVDRTRNGCLTQTQLAKLRHATYCGMQCVLMTFRGSADKQQVCRVALEAAQRQCMQYPHPNVMQILGVVVSSSSPATVVGVLMEFLPVTLHDLVHRDRIALTREEILQVALDVLQVLAFYHERGCTLGPNGLTSKKVAFDRSNKLKVRVFTNAVIDTLASNAEVAKSSDQLPWMTFYVMPSNLLSIQDAEVLAQRRDFYAFGILLLELCLNEAPNPEFGNRVSSAGHIDPLLEVVVRLCIDPNYKHGIVKPTAESLLSAVVQQINNNRATALHSPANKRRSWLDFPCFIHADRYFQTREEESVTQARREQATRDAVQLKRLAAVEEELVEEHKNFDVIVMQLDRARQDIRAQEDHISQLADKLREANDKNLDLEQAQNDKERAMDALRVDMKAMEKAILEKEQHIARLIQQQHGFEHDIQGLARENNQLRDKLQRVLDDKVSTEAELARVRGLVGGERDAIEELEGRLKQAIYRWEQEKKAHIVAEKRLEALNLQLVTMEEERAAYCVALLMSPTGNMDQKSTIHYVLGLKDKEITATSSAWQDACNTITRLEDELSQLRTELEAVARNRDRLDKELRTSLEESQQQQRENESLEHDLTHIRGQCERQLEHIKSLKETIVALEQRIAEQEQRRLEQERARRLKQCMTPGCDAPKYLIRPSGYCSTCEDRKGGSSADAVKAREANGGMPASPQRTVSRGITPIGPRLGQFAARSKVANNSKNTHVVELMNRILETEENDAMEEQSEVDLQLIGYIKQFTELMKENESLKDDLPECQALKLLIQLLHQHDANLALEIECCKAISTVVFNHDRNRIIIVAEGVIEVLLQVMKRFQYEPKFQEATLVVLTNLAHNCETNRKRIMTAGGVDTILEAMQTFPHHVGVQKRSCWALLTLAGSDLLCDHVAARGGVGAILAAMLNFPADDDVQYYGCWALLNLVSGKSAVRLRAFAKQEGVVEVAEAAVACFPDHPGIQDKARLVLQLVQSVDAVH
ncbi:TPA: hypothetical protein N0F65_006778 [Lagenidium giganteum]|uniref:Protein kinase domain-containing protein n=1 Tax=Lagenidium giganteum TaxID=4803 RepID=A0AAV2ZEB5_9STRA|nr:TPA: hypothetical protein N0F65_006778 [Lagenidium giganteum]